MSCFFMVLFDRSAALFGKPTSCRLHIHAIVCFEGWGGGVFERSQHETSQLNASKPSEQPSERTNDFFLVFANRQERGGGLWYCTKLMPLSQLASATQRTRGSPRCVSLSPGFHSYIWKYQLPGFHPSCLEAPKVAMVSMNTCNLHLLIATGSSRGVWLFRRKHMHLVYFYCELVWG